MTTKKKATARKTASAKKTARAKKSGTFSADERAAMKERTREAKTPGGGEADVQAKIAAMSPADRAMATRIHAIVAAQAPALAPKTYYGMPAYAKDGEIVCFFQPAQKFKSRYARICFADAAQLDDGVMWPTSYALLQLGAREEKQIAALVKKAAG